MSSPAERRRRLEELRQFHSDFPSINEEVLAMAKKDQEHLHEMEKGELSLKRRGQLFGFIVALSFLCAAFILILEHHDTAGTVVGSTDLVALVAVFVVGRNLARDSSSPTAARAEREDPKESSIPIAQAINRVTERPELSDEDRSLWEKLSRDIGLAARPPASDGGAVSNVDS